MVRGEDWGEGRVSDRGEGWGRGPGVRVRVGDGGPVVGGRVRGRRGPTEMKTRLQLEKPMSSAVHTPMGSTTFLNVCGERAGCCSRGWRVTAHATAATIACPRRGQNV